MDADRFATLCRALTATPSRRDIARALTGLAVGGGLGPVLGVADGEAKKKKKKKKRGQSAAPSCTPTCGSYTCGPNGCGGVCGRCGECQTCQGGSCVANANGTACAGGFCQTGSCVICNQSGQTCCPGGQCSGGLECTVDNTCGACGGEGQSCCFAVDARCDAGLKCLDSLFARGCVRCGGVNELCCFSAGLQPCDAELECCTTPLDTCRPSGECDL